MFKFLNDMWEAEQEEGEILGAIFLISFIGTLIFLLVNFTFTKLIVYGIISFIMAELFFIGLCKYSKNKEYNKSSYLIGVKIGSLFQGLVLGGLVITIGEILYGIYNLIKNYFQNVLFILGIVAVVCLFFWLNILLAKWVRRKKNGKRKKK